MGGNFREEVRPSQGHRSYDSYEGSLATDCGRASRKSQQTRFAPLLAVGDDTPGMCPA